MSALAEFEQTPPVFRELPPFPSVALRLLQLVKCPESAIEDVVEVMKSDVSLAAEVLRRANSAFYGLRGTVDSLQRGVTLLGVDEIKKIATAIAVGGYFWHSKPDIRRLWRQAIARALTAERIAFVTGVPAGKVYTAALLADIGLYGFLLNFDLTGVFGKVADCHELLAYENEHLGVTHCDAGAWLALQWQFPADVAEALAAHHREPGWDPLASHIYWADQAVTFAGFGLVGPDPTSVQSEAYRSLLSGSKMLGRALPAEAQDLAGWVIAQMPPGNG